MDVSGGTVNEDDVQTEVLVRAHRNKPPGRCRTRWLVLSPDEVQRVIDIPAAFASCSYRRK